MALSIVAASLDAEATGDLGTVESLFNPYWGRAVEDAGRESLWDATAHALGSFGGSTGGTRTTP
jgi:hypothetical protein